MFKILEDNNVVPLQEDGTYWSGMLFGGKECGSKEAIEKQRTIFQLAVNVEGQFLPSKQGLSIMWCKMPSGKYEVVAYLN